MGCDPYRSGDIFFCRAQGAIKAPRLTHNCPAEFIVTPLCALRCLPVPARRNSLRCNGLLPASIYATAFRVAGSPTPEEVVGAGAIFIKWSFKNVKMHRCQATQRLAIFSMTPMHTAPYEGSISRNTFFEDSNVKNVFFLQRTILFYKNPTRCRVCV
jgi:hypothetical protein